MQIAPDSECHGTGMDAGAAQARSRGTVTGHGRRHGHGAQGVGTSKITGHGEETNIDVTQTSR